MASSGLFLLQRLQVSVARVCGIQLAPLWWHLADIWQRLYDANNCAPLRSHTASFLNKHMLALLSAEQYDKSVEGPETIWRGLSECLRSPTTEPKTPPYRVNQHFGAGQDGLRVLPDKLYGTMYC